MSKIVLDAGHGGWDNGAVYYGRREKDDALRLAQAVASRLRARGQTVIMTRDSDVYVDLLQRSAISNYNNADMFVSFHRNANVNPQANGVEIYVQNNSPQRNATIARTVLNQLVAAGIQNDRGVKYGNFSVLRVTKAPAILIELGFISNPADNTLFDTRFNAYADAVTTGIIQSLGTSSGGSSGSGSSGNATTRAIQQTLNNRYATGLSVDGLYGPGTKRGLVQGLQTELNRSYGAGLAQDGVFGARTKAAIRAQRRGANNNLVYLLQAALFFKGYQIGVDGAFGPATENAVRDFQSKNGLAVDGVAGGNTFERLINSI